MDKYDKLKIKMANAIDLAKTIKESPLDVTAKSVALKNIYDILDDYRFELINLTFDLTFGVTSNEAE